MQELESTVVEDLLEVEKLLDELYLLLLCHLLKLETVKTRLEVVGSAQSLGISHHGLSYHLTPLHLLPHSSVVVLQTILPQLPLNQDLLHRLPQKRQLRSVKVFL